MDRADRSHMQTPYSSECKRDAVDLERGQSYPVLSRRYGGTFSTRRKPPQSVPTQVSGRHNDRLQELFYGLLEQNSLMQEWNEREFFTQNIVRFSASALKRKDWGNIFKVVTSDGQEHAILPRDLTTREACEIVQTSAQIIQVANQSWREPLPTTRQKTEKKEKDEKRSTEDKQKAPKGESLSRRQKALLIQSQRELFQRRLFYSRFKAGLREIRIAKKDERIAELERERKDIQKARADALTHIRRAREMKDEIRAKEEQQNVANSVSLLRGTQRTHALSRYFTLRRFIDARRQDRQQTSSFEADLRASDRLVYQGHIEKQDKALQEQRGTIEKKEQEQKRLQSQASETLLKATQHPQRSRAFSAWRAYSQERQQQRKAKELRVEIEQLAQERQAKRALAESQRTEEQAPSMEELLGQLDSYGYNAFEEFARAGNFSMLGEMINSALEGRLSAAERGLLLQLEKILPREQAVEARPRTPGCLVNTTGAKCYSNAIVQMLSSSSIANTIQRLAKIPDTAYQGDERAQNMLSLVKTLNLIIEYIQAEQAGQSPPVLPEGLTIEDYQHQLDSLVSRLNSRYERGQQDANEFLGWLVAHVLVPLGATELKSFSGYHYHFVNQGSKESDIQTLRQMRAPESDLELEGTVSGESNVYFDLPELRKYSQYQRQETSGWLWGRTTTSYYDLVQCMKDVYGGGVITGQQSDGHRRRFLTEEDAKRSEMWIAPPRYVQDRDGRKEILPGAYNVTKAFDMPVYDQYGKQEIGRVIYTPVSWTCHSLGSLRGGHYKQFNKTPQGIVCHNDSQIEEFSSPEQYIQSHATLVRYTAQYTPLAG